MKTSQTHRYDKSVERYFVELAKCSPRGVNMDTLTTVQTEPHRSARALRDHMDVLSDVKAGLMALRAEVHENAQSTRQSLAQITSQLNFVGWLPALASNASPHGKNVDAIAEESVANKFCRNAEHLACVPERCAPVMDKRGWSSANISVDKFSSATTQPYQCLSREETSTESSSQPQSEHRASGDEPNVIPQMQPLMARLQDISRTLHEQCSHIALMDMKLQMHSDGSSDAMAKLNKEVTLLRDTMAARADPQVTPAAGMQGFITKMAELQTWLEPLLERKGKLANEMMQELSESSFPRTRLDRRKHEFTLSSDESEPPVGGSPRLGRSGHSVWTESVCSEDSFNSGEAQHESIEGQAFEAVKAGDLQRMRELLGAGLSPNAQLHNKQFGHHHYSMISLLPAAVRSRSVEMVQMLVDCGASLQSRYSSLVGHQKMDWSGTAIFCCPSMGDVQMLKLLVSLKADVHEKSSNGTLVWECAYFGQHQMLSYLLECGANFWSWAASPDREGVSYSPLHICVTKGHVACVQMLVEARAECNSENEEAASPLIDAIELCHPEILCTLVANGASFLKPDSGDVTSRCTLRTPLELPCRRNSYTDSGPLQRIIQLGNPMLTRAAAMGLQQHEEAVNNLYQQDVRAFMESSQVSKKEILRALFRHRRIRYVAFHQEAFERKSAYVWRSRKLPGNVPHFIPGVVVGNYSFSDFEQKFKRREKLDTNELAFLDALAPQEPLRTSCIRRACTSQDSHVVFILTYECLMPNIWNKLWVMKAIKDTSALDKCWAQMHYRAVIHTAWLRVKRVAQAEVVAQIGLGVFFLASAELLRDLDLIPDVHGGIVHVRPPDATDRKLRILSIAALPCFAFEFFRELLDFMSNVDHGWTREYITDTSNYLDFARVTLDLLFILDFMFYGARDYASFSFRIAFAVASYLKWTKVLFCLTPFSKFGLPFMPIFFALMDIGPFALIMLMYVAGLTHAFTAMDLTSDSYLLHFIETFNYVTALDFSSVPEFHSPVLNNRTQEWIIKAIMAAVTFLIPIALMNIFIAALGLSYNTGVENMEQLYQSKRAATVFDLLAAKKMFINICRRLHLTHRNITTKQHLWVCWKRAMGDLT